ncbi:SOS-response transcriptional repressor, LexA [Desulfotomaculum arcticum]|uniref:LexA repressor n=1 Tax=Desulfotruncus arcticus DSM 17038 TaxID=1121424 RepID=A0A1I2TPE3_9FIRM|nr:transcriptional repressor LexA [Desulfotruncus arcticus]SFG66039.1 SOS-response transcriptional repressor, LexA [Desulfotomaculum arcticum] [Desulfotruncus arcticus DSM 17038]
MALNQQEKDILNFIKQYIKESGYPPTVREIGKAVGFRSSSTVHGYLHRLHEKGAIKLDPTKPRALVVIEDEYTKEIITVPVLGQVAAGLPLLAEENYEDVFPLPADFTGSGDLFILRIKGDSMIEAGILEGDLVVVRKQPKVENGEIAVAMIEGEATVKRFFKEKDHILLQPENSLYAPIIAREVEILGKVVGLVRRY